MQLRTAVENRAGQRPPDVLMSIRIAEEEDWRKRKRRNLQAICRQKSGPALGRGNAAALRLSAKYYLEPSPAFAFALQIICVIVPMGQ